MAAGLGHCNGDAVTAPRCFDIRPDHWCLLLLCLPLSSPPCLCERVDPEQGAFYYRFCLLYVRIPNIWQP